MAVSLTAPQFGHRFEPVLEVASTAEAFGYAGVFLFDHLVPLGAPHRPILELATTLGALAASTKRISIGSLVMRAPMRGPAISAGIAATAAAVAPGRIVLGLGTGDSLSHDEADRFGEERRALDERIRDVADTIAATSDLGIERWVGGLHDRVLDLATLVEGWNGWAIEPDRVVSIGRRLHERSPGLVLTWGGSVLLGRTRSHLDELLAARSGEGATITGTVPEVHRHLEALIGAGVSHLVLTLVPNRRETWESFAELVLPKLV